MSRGQVMVGHLSPGHVSNCFKKSLQDLLFFDQAMNQRIVSHPLGEMGIEVGSGGIVSGRNRIVEVFLDHSEADWLFMVDSDMGFAPDTVERLIESAHAVKRPVVGALCFAHKSDGTASFHGARYRATPTVYEFYEDDDRIGFVPRFDYERNTLQSSSATGAACVLIHRLALEAVRDKYGDEWFDTIRHPKGTTFSEDMSFCVRVAGCDLPLYVDTAVKTTHDKGGVFLDEEFYDVQQWVLEQLGGFREAVTP